MNLTKDNKLEFTPQEYSEYKSNSFVHGPSQGMNCLLMTEPNPVPIVPKTCICKKELHTSGRCYRKTDRLICTRCIENCNK